MALCRNLTLAPGASLAKSGPLTMELRFSSELWVDGSRVSHRCANSLSPQVAALGIATVTMGQHLRPWSDGEAAHLFFVSVVFPAIAIHSRRLAARGRTAFVVANHREASSATRAKEPWREQRHLHRWVPASAGRDDT